MPTDLDLGCTCGKVRGIARGVSPRSVNHCVCYCRDCQSFAHFLGRAADVLDAHGGTDIFQMSPASLEITTGLESIACMRLTPKGLLRWYAGCCRTPIGNSLPSSGVPFVGMIRTFVREPADTALGPVRGHGYPKSASGDRSTLPQGGAPTVLLIARMMTLLLRWRLRGHHRRSPFFHADTGRPIVEPRVLRAEEREELRRRSG